MHFYLLFLGFLSSLLYTSLAIDIKGRVEWNANCRGIAELGHAKVLLDDGSTYGTVRQNGLFVIPDVEPGTYILSVNAHNHVFDKLRIDITDAESLPEVRPYLPGTPLSPPSHVMLPYPIVLPARARNNYFVPQQSFNLLGMFKSPMMLMMVGGGALVLVTPYLLKNMDPEMLEEVKGRQAKMQNIQSSMQSGDFKSGLTSLLGAEDSPKNAGSSSGVQSHQSQTKGKGGKGKRR